MRRILENAKLKRNNKIVLKILKKNMHHAEMNRNSSVMYLECYLNEKDLKRICKLLGDNETKFEKHIYM